MVKMTKVMEALAIIGTGLVFHLNRWSIVEFQVSQLPALVPNVASTLFTFSLLCILNTMRPLWPRGWYRPKRIITFFIELTLILLAVDFLLRQIWIPSLRLLNFMCNFMGQHIVITMSQRAPILTQWMRKEAFYVARFLLALTAFVLMLDTTGMIELAVEKVRHRYAVSVAGGSAPTSRLRDEIKLRKHGLRSNLTNKTTTTNDTEIKNIAAMSDVTANNQKLVDIMWDENTTNVENIDDNENNENFESSENNMISLNGLHDDNDDLPTVFRSFNNDATLSGQTFNIKTRPKRAAVRRIRHRHANAPSTTVSINRIAADNDAECTC